MSFHSVGIASTTADRLVCLAPRSSANECFANSYYFERRSNDNCSSGLLCFLSGCHFARQRATFCCSLPGQGNLALRYHSLEAAQTSPDCSLDTLATQIESRRYSKGYSAFAALCQSRPHRHPSPCSNQNLFLADPMPGSAKSNSSPSLIGLGSFACD